MIKYVISGVARSGTTALYDMVASYLTQRDSNWAVCYEPYLWGRAVWSLPPEDRATEFEKTSSLHPLGIYAHQATDLFTAELQPATQALLEDIETDARDTLVKFIRASGRLESILRYRSTVRIVHIVRNPLDVVNSQGQLFSFFGEEFHPSDHRRFEVAVRNRWPNVALPAQSASLEWRLEWWRWMNQAALESARAYPDAIMLISQEALRTAPEATISRVIKFLCGNVDAEMLPRSGEHGASVRGRVALSRKEVEAAEPYLAIYENEFLPHTQTAEIVDWPRFKEQLLARYAQGASDAVVPEGFPPTDATPLKVRGVLVRAMRRQAQLEAERRKLLQEKAALEKERKKLLQENAALRNERDVLLLVGETLNAALAERLPDPHRRSTAPLTHKSR